MVTFCDCETCKKIKKEIINPKCGYCNEHHSPKLACPEYISAAKNDTQKALSYLKENDNHPICGHCGTKHNPYLICSVERFAKEEKENSDQDEVIHAAIRRMKWQNKNYLKNTTYNIVKEIYLLIISLKTSIIKKMI